MMHKKFILLGTTLLALLFISFYSTQIELPTLAQTKQEIPSYAKWGRLAMQETQTKYPNADIIDYLYEGSELKDDSTIEKFKLWLKEPDKEFGVLVRIEFTSKTEKVLNITFEETSKWGVNVGYN